MRNLRQMAGDAYAAGRDSRAEILRESATYVEGMRQTAERENQVFINTAEQARGDRLPADDLAELLQAALSEKAALTRALRDILVAKFKLDPSATAEASDERNLVIVADRICAEAGHVHGPEPTL